MTFLRTRREFVRDLGIGAAAVPFLLNLPSLGFANQQSRKQRLVIMFSPNGVVPSAFWPEVFGGNATMIGIPGAKLFAGVSQEVLTNQLYNDPVHLNRNGQKFFTPLITPALMQIYENQIKP